MFAWLCSWSGSPAAPEPRREPEPERVFDFRRVPGPGTWHCSDLGYPFDTRRSGTHDYFEELGIARKLVLDDGSEIPLQPTDGWVEAAAGVFVTSAGSSHLLAARSPSIVTVLYEVRTYYCDDDFGPDRIERSESTTKAMGIHYELLRFDDEAAPDAGLGRPGDAAPS